MQKRIWTVIGISVFIISIFIYMTQRYQLNRLWFILLLTVSLLLILITTLYHIYAYKAIEASPYIKELIALNVHTKKLFHTLNDTKLNHAYDRKSQLDNASTKEFLEDDIYNRLEIYSELNKRYLHNVDVLKTYEKAYQDLSSAYTVMKHTLKTYVIHLQATHIKLNLSTNQKIIVKLTYTSPQGRNHYVRKNEYSYQLLNEIILKTNEIKRVQESEAYQRKVERQKMSSRLRFLIFQRDHYTCRICGKSKYDKVKLHVDHIIPIAKGGKTEENNLQTLCEVCNLGKSDLNMYR
jgi:5-methylcytosine-specific restriction endonuclease McrA